MSEMMLSGRKKRNSPAYGLYMYLPGVFQFKFSILGVCWVGVLGQAILWGSFILSSLFKG